jgi:hypothetical protein
MFVPFSPENGLLNFFAVTVTASLPPQLFVVAPSDSCRRRATTRMRRIAGLQLKNFEISVWA